MYNNNMRGERIKIVTPLFMKILYKHIKILYKQTQQPCFQKRGSRAKHYKAVAVSITGKLISSQFFYSATFIS